MRNPLRNLVSRPEGGLTLRERLAGTRERCARALRRDRSAPCSPEPARPDPIFGLIEEARRLTQEHGRLIAISADLPDSHPAWKAENEAHVATWEHVRGVLLKTVPTTAAGCVALARFACEFTEDQGVSLEYESNDPVLALIARSPAL